MSVASYIPDDLFVVRVVKSLQTNPDNRWVNTYELRAVLAGSTDELLAAGLNFVTMEKALHLPAVEFKQLSISTWEPDSVPYNPETFISVTLIGNGSRGQTGDISELRTCWNVTRVAAFGRFGHIFYRGVLTENDQVAPAGKSVFAPGNLIQGDLAAAITSSNVDEHLGIAPSSGLGMVMVNKSGSQIRPVIGLSSAGISHVPNDHAWYNRTTAP